ncbi:MAG: RNA polymerase sigma factor [Deltaproteobacteria bacterium]|nr:RNA polymerase sigma factor [Deltaproteobacteria bacterium]MBW2532130.1 RNA polymerase sigma factor [Deltaproteobacteria bacterium]
MDEELKRAAARVAGGDPAAFRVIVERTSARLYRLGARMMGSTADAEDVLQDAYIKAFQALAAGRFDGRSSVATWLYRIATNACLDALRRRKVRPVAEAQPPEASFDGRVSAEARLALAELDRWLGELPPEQRVAVVLKSVEGLTSAEIAEVLQCSEGAVEQRLVRARAALRERRSRQS